MQESGENDACVLAGTPRNSERRCNMKNIVKRVRTGIVLLLLVYLICYLIDDVTINGIVAIMCLALFVVVLQVNYASIEELKETITDQQTQIADLKRELEEMKRKE